MLDMEGRGPGWWPRLFHPTATHHTALVFLASVQGIAWGARGGGANRGATGSWLELCRFEKRYVIYIDLSTRVASLPEKWTCNMNDFFLYQNSWNGQNAAHHFISFSITCNNNKFLLEWLEDKQVILWFMKRQKQLGKNKQQVAILGNCKRFDVYVALAHPVEKQQVKWHISQVDDWYQRTGHK